MNLSANSLKQALFSLSCVLFSGWFALLLGSFACGSTVQPAECSACGQDAGSSMDAGPLLPETMAACITYPDNIPTLGIDAQDPQCQEANWKPAACAPGQQRHQASTSQQHVCLPNPIRYSSPPSSGPHRPEWGRWGEYSYIPPQRWLHNLEHGGVVLLYHPCAPDSVKDALRTLAKEWPKDDTGAFRWILTPYPGLTSTLAVIAWEHSYSAHCFDKQEVTDFIQKHYRKAPEDFGFEGTFREGWLGP